MTQEVTENLNNSTANKETTSSNFILYKILLINKLLNPYFKISPKRKLQDQCASHGGFYQIFKEKLTFIFQKCFQKIAEE